GGDVGRGEGLGGVVGRLEGRVRGRAWGRMSARASVPPEEVARWSAELTARGRVLASVPVEVVDAGGVVVLSATVEWFIARGGQDAEVRDGAARVAPAG